MNTSTSSLLVSQCGGEGNPVTGLVMSSEGSRMAGGVTRTKLFENHSM